MIVLNTNVVSELMKADPDRGVLRWLAGRTPSELVTTAVTLAEVMYGIRRLPPGQRRDRLHRVALEVFADFADSVLGFDVPAAVAYAEMVSECERHGRPISGFDAQIAAIALSRAATLATRNVKDFKGLGLEVIDPWSATG